MASTSGLDDLVKNLEGVSGLFTGENHDDGCTLEVGLPSWLEEMIRRFNRGDLGLGGSLDLVALWMKNTIEYASIFSKKVVLQLNFPIAFKCVKKKVLEYMELPCRDWNSCKPEETQFDIKLTVPINTVGTDAWKDGVKECMRWDLDIDQGRCLLKLIDKIGVLGWGDMGKGMTRDELEEFLARIVEELNDWLHEQFIPLLWEAIAAAMQIRCKCEKTDSRSNDFMFSFYSPQMKNKLGHGMGLMNGKTVLVPSTLQAEIDRIAERHGAYPRLSGARDLLTNRRIP